jgi:RNA polymerase sigma-70 factor, ECF subfamily
VPGLAVEAVEAVDVGADDATVRAALAGDEVAFGRVYRSVQPGLFRYLSALVGPDAEDVAAETWAQACRDLHRFSGGLDAFRGWVATIGRHRALDHLRAARRRPVDPVAPEDLPPGRPGPDAEQGAQERMGTRDALHLISTLPADQAEAVLLRAVMGLDAATAAAVLGKRPGAVRTAAHRGLRTLAARLDARPVGSEPGPGA